jgi:hypothetical protein
MQTSPERALSYWQDMICESLLELRIDSAKQSAFFVQIERFSLGPLKANFLSLRGQRIWRSRKTNAHDGFFHLIHIRRGIQLVETEGLNLQLEPGDCILVDCLSSFSFYFPEGVEALVLEIRRDWLESWIPATEQAADKVFGRGLNWGATLASALSNITAATMASPHLPDSTIAQNIATLLALAAGLAVPSLMTH